jgi:hypothetical protein
LKKALLIVALALVVLAGCESVSSVASGAAAVGSLAGRAGGATGPVMAGPADLRSDEVLCAQGDEHNPMDASYLAAKVLTPASAATNNQAEVIFVDGKKAWTKIVLPTHKAAKEEFKVGAVVLFHVWASQADMTADDYRLHTWDVGRVTSIDEMFKGLVEVSGQKKNTKWIRIPNQPMQ